MLGIDLPAGVAPRSCLLVIANMRGVAGVKWGGAGIVSMSTTSAESAAECRAGSTIGVSSASWR